jgi:predicted AAA+ superfamily ATPase
MKRIKLRFTPKLEVEFVDRDRGIRHVYELAEKGTRFPVVVFGPEGCGKTAWLRQAVEVLKEQGFDSIYIDVLSKEHIAYTDVKEVVDRISDVVADVTGYSPIKLADLAILLANKLLKRWRKKKIALLIDEVFRLLDWIELKPMLKCF